MIITPATELDAVNEIIGAIGESPVNTLENAMNVDVINAQRILSRVNRQQQSRGWSFNIQEEYILNPDEQSHKIRWSDSFLYLKGSNGEKYGKSGEYLKDITNNTTTFMSPITVSVILLVPFEEMLEAMRQFITAKAAINFQIRYLGDASLTQDLQQDVAEAWQHLQEYEIDTNDFNIIEHDNVMSLLQR